MTELMAFGDCRNKKLSNPHICGREKRTGIFHCGEGGKAAWKCPSFRRVSSVVNIVYVNVYESSTFPFQYVLDSGDPREGNVICL